MRVTSALLILSSCAAVRLDYPCVSACGVTYVDGASAVGAPSPYTCASFKEAEERTLFLYEKHKVSEIDDSFANACAAVSGYTVYVHPMRSWMGPYGVRIDGLTNCMRKTIDIHNTPGGRNSLAHEYGHAIQACQSPVLVDIGEDRHHSNWRTAHINDALKEWEDGSP